MRWLDGCRDDVYIITGPLYLPKRVTLHDEQGNAVSKNVVTYEVIGDPPNVAVPTHFFKLVFATRAAAAGVTHALPAPGSPPSGAAPAGHVGGSLEMVAAAFVLPNEPIPESTPLTEFVVPIEQLERHSGLLFFPYLPLQQVAIKPLCESGRCQLPPPNFWLAHKERKAIDGAAAPAAAPAAPTAPAAAPTAPAPAPAPTVKKAPSATSLPPPPLPPSAK